MKFYRPVANRFFWLNSNDAVKVSKTTNILLKDDSDDTRDANGVTTTLKAYSGMTNVTTTNFKWKLPHMKVKNGQITLFQISSINTLPDQIYCIRLRNIKGENIYDSSGNDHILYLNSGMNDGVLGGSSILQISNSIVDYIEIEISQRSITSSVIASEDGKTANKIIYSNEFVDGINTNSFINTADVYTRTPSTPADQSSGAIMAAAAADLKYNNLVALRTLDLTTAPNLNIHFTIGINIKDYYQEDLECEDYNPDLKQKLSKLII